MDQTNHDPRDGAALSLGGAVLDDAAVDELLQQVVQLALLTVESAHAVSITVADQGGYRTSNSTVTGVLAIDEVQYHKGDGPCLEAIRTARPVQVTVGADEGRWPWFDERALDHGVVRVLSTPLTPAPGAAIGALNIYASEGEEFSRDELRKAAVLGEHAAILVGNALALVDATQLNEQLRKAVDTREVIGVAKGIFMERQSCTRDEAFDLLRRASQRENRKLRELAEELVVRVEARARQGRERPTR